MNKLLLTFLVIHIIFGGLSSCNAPEKKVLNASKELKIDLNKKEYLLLIPNAGCPGCTSSAESFMLMHLNSSKIVFVLTNFSSKKNIKTKLGSDIFNYRNIVLDEENIFYANGVMASYPIVYTIDSDRSIIKTDTVSPSNPNTLANLEANLFR